MTHAHITIFYRLPKRPPQQKRAQFITRAPHLTLKNLLGPLQLVPVPEGQVHTLAPLSQLLLRDKLRLE